MAAVSVMRLLLFAALSASVSARLGTGETEVVPSYFGEAAVVPVNAASNTEVPEAPAKLPILLTQGSLQTLGGAVAEVAAQPVVAVSSVDGDLSKVCERTRTALSAQGDSSAMPSGPVYKECMAALAPLRDHQQDSDAVDTLSDCMALVNALVANKGGDCQVALNVMQAARKPPAPKPAAASVVSAVPKPFGGKVVEAVEAPKPKAVTLKTSVVKQDADALDLVSEAMTEVCTETVRDAEVGIKSESDAMHIATAVAPICQDYATKHLGADAAATPLTAEWCHQLDGRLTIALETGFFFALQPEEAERQAAETNPYASTTRRKFCNRFVNSLRHQAQDGAFYLNGAPAAAAVAPKPELPLAPKPELPLAAAVVEPPAALPELPTLPPAPKAVEVAPVAAAVAVKASPAQVPVVAIAHTADAAPHVAEPQPQQKPLAAMPFPKGTGVDMLRLVQALSTRTEWNEACGDMISRLSSEEGSVTEEYALGDGETAEGTKVLTFNAADQGEIRKCAAQLKVLAIQSGVLKKATGLLQTGSTLTSADDAEAIMDSPWAADACGDIAHGYLTAHLAHPNMAVSDYCPLYARDLQAMHVKPPPAEQAKQDIEQMRKRGSKLKRKLTQTVQAATPQVKKPPAALITQGAAVSSTDEEQEGMDFWKDMLK